MTLYVDSPENGIKNSDDNIQDIIPGTLNTHQLTDHHIVRILGLIALLTASLPMHL